MNMRTLRNILVTVLVIAPIPSTLSAQHASDEVMDSYRSDSGKSVKLAVDFFCQRETTRPSAMLDDLADRMVAFALADPGKKAARRVAFDLSVVGSPPPGLDCTPYERAWDAVATIYREKDVRIGYLLKLGVKRGVEYGLTLLPDMDPTTVEGKSKLCGMLVHVEQGGELTLLPGGTLEFAADPEYDPDEVRIVRPGWSARTEALAEELMLEGLIPRTGWPWSPCGIYAGGFVSGFADDGTPLLPDTGWAAIQDKRGFYRAPSGDTLRVLKRR